MSNISYLIAQGEILHKDLAEICNGDKKRSEFHIDDVTSWSDKALEYLYSVDPAIPGNVPHSDKHILSLKQNEILSLMSSIMLNLKTVRSMGG